MRYWLLKTEPEAYSIERLRREKTTPWTGVRNFQARNNMQEMGLGDLGLFYHSSIPQPAAVGICKVVKTAYPDFSQFERDGEYFDGRAKPDRPIWMMVDVGFVEEFAASGNASRNARGAAPYRDGVAQAGTTLIRAARHDRTNGRSCSNWRVASSASVVLIHRVRDVRLV